MNDLQTALAPLGIAVEITIPGRVAIVDIAHVKTAREQQLTPHILRINDALRDAGLLDKWRAKKGGSTTRRWILLIGNKR